MSKGFDCRSLGMNAKRRLYEGVVVMKQNLRVGGKETL